jgi:hypothetical protein
MSCISLKARLLWTVNTGLSPSFPIFVAKNALIRHPARIREWIGYVTFPRIDEYKTARKAGFKVYPLRNRDERQNRLGLLLVD